MKRGLVHFPFLQEEAPKAKNVYLQEMGQPECGWQWHPRASGPGPDWLAGCSGWEILGRELGSGCWSSFLAAGTGKKHRVEIGGGQA